MRQHEEPPEDQRSPDKHASKLSIGNALFIGHLSLSKTMPRLRNADERSMQSDPYASGSGS